MGAQRSYVVGEEIKGPVRRITAPRIEWYDSAMLSAATNELRQVGINIHTDAAFAKSEGFTGVNADGMIMTNWCSEMLTRAFGMDYLERGELRTKYIKPVLTGVQLHVKGRVKTIEPLGNDSTHYTIEIWCEDQHCTRLVDGEAAVEVKAR